MRNREQINDKMGYENNLTKPGLQACIIFIEDLLTLSTKHMPKVLVIEDEASIRAVLKDILKDQKELGLQVEEAKDGAEGLAKLESEHFDLALCDIKMPKMDGMEVLQKAKEKGIATTFVMISAHGTTELAVDATKMGSGSAACPPTCAARDRS